MKKIKTDIKTPLDWRRTKIIATLGPSSGSYFVIRKLIESNVNVFRLNMSHGTHDEHFQLVSNIKKIVADTGKQVAILVDLCGPKIRVGKFKSGKIILTDNKKVVIRCKEFEGDDKLISSQYRNLYKDVKKGHRIFLDDGKIELTVTSVSGIDIECKVKYGGVLKDKKGMNLPDTEISTTSYTEKDRHDTDFAIRINADFIAMSFVKNNKDIRKIKKYMENKQVSIPVIAKIERKEAISNIDEIIQESYGIMIARGDLGIELPAQKVPIIQKDLVSAARRNNCPVIVATQMLESMIASPRPTRAEVSDVANAVLSSADAVMLSAETASGEYPVKSVEMMDDILREIENYQINKNCFVENDAVEQGFGITTEREAVSYAVRSLTQNLDLKAIIVPTRTGITAAIIASDRPISPLIAVCTDIMVCKRLMLHWGVISFNLKEDEVSNWKELSRDISNKCLKTKKGNSILLVSGFNDDPDLNEPVVKLVRL
ncbi:MAG: pyruvate kinase [Gammaproteobacteria bacterium]|nr:pyruvate kinase [Gammaproteobacteria bacterium]